MPKLTVGGQTIEGVRKAEVRILHSSRAPEQIPIMEWEVILRLQNSDFLPKWALAPQGKDRFRKCELVINHSNNQVAHTWTLLNGYVHEYRDVEFPEAGSTGDTTENFCTRLIIRGQMPEAKDYTGDNVMQIAAGEEPALPG